MVANTTSIRTVERPRRAATRRVLRVHPRHPSPRVCLGRDPTLTISNQPPRMAIVDSRSQLRLGGIVPSRRLTKGLRRPSCGWATTKLRKRPHSSLPRTCPTQPNHSLNRTRVESGSGKQTTRGGWRSAVRVRSHLAGEKEDRNRAIAGAPRRVWYRKGVHLKLWVSWGMLSASGSPGCGLSPHTPCLAPDHATSFRPVSENRRRPTCRCSRSKPTHTS